MINIAILGYGTVGSGVAKVLSDNRELISQRTGRDINVKYILDLREFPGDPNEKKVVHDFDTIVNDPEVSIICETMGGTKPAFDFTLRALNAGKCVCTSNKELVECHGAQLLEAAKQHGCRYLFEASVGGGIPIIRTIAEALTAESITGITGILNGTTNYILTRMDREGVPFEPVLKDAQAKGYAEKDPTADIEGHDPCRKIAILTSLVLQKKVDFKDIPTEGITKITNEDFAFAKSVNRSIKLLAMSRIEEDGVFARVSPFMVSKDHPLACVNDVFNAIHLHSNMLDDSMYYGRGAGMLATASAVCADVIDCAVRPGESARSFWSSERVALKDPASLKSRFFIRADENILPRQELEKALGLKPDYAEDMEGFDGDVIKKAGISGQYGAFTPAIGEGEAAAALKELKGVLSIIRVF